MSAMMSDVISGQISAGTVNAACNAGGKLLKAVEMQMKYGGRSGGEGGAVPLCGDGPALPTPPAQPPAKPRKARKKE